VYFSLRLGIVIEIYGVSVAGGKPTRRSRAERYSSSSLSPPDGPNKRKEVAQGIDFGKIVAEIS
jgi:hypothetical protein